MHQEGVGPGEHLVDRRLADMRVELDVAEPERARLGLQGRRLDAIAIEPDQDVGAQVLQSGRRFQHRTQPLRPAKVAAIDHDEPALRQRLRLGLQPGFGVGPVADGDDFRGRRTPRDQGPVHALRLHDDGGGSVVDQGAERSDQAAELAGAPHARGGEGVGPKVLDVEHEGQSAHGPGQGGGEAHGDRRVVDIGQVEALAAEQAKGQGREEKGQIIQRPAQGR